MGVSFEARRCVCDKNPRQTLLSMAFSLLIVPSNYLEKRTMRWTPSTFMNSLLRGSSSSDLKRAAPTIDDIRQTMLEILGDRGAETYPVVQLRVTYAADIQDLWYLRGDIMAAIAAMDGEAIAKAQLANLSEMFKGLLPSGLSSRASPLGQ